jgi:hypothetical protein
MTNPGDRCNIFKDIDDLSEARTVQELTARLRPILNQLAYVAVTEGSVAATNEEWHEKFTDNLYEATADDHRQASLAQVRLPASAPPPVRAASAAPASKRSASSSKPRNRDAFPSDNVAHPGIPPAVRSRPAPGNLPPSLMAIMNGSHPSFDERED